MTAAGYLAISSLLPLAIGLGQAAAGERRATTTDRPAAEVASLCAACHRLDNVPTGIPPLVSLSADQIKAMMRGFRTGTRPSHIMKAVSRTLSDVEITTVADYLAGLSGDKGR